MTTVCEWTFFFVQDIELRQSEVVLCGGAENMSQAPYTVRNVRFGTALGVDLKVRDSMTSLPPEYASSISLWCMLHVDR